QVVALVAVGWTPDSPEERAVVHDTARVLRQYRQQAVLGRRQLDLHPVANDRLAGQVDRHAALAYDPARARDRLSSPEHYAASSKKFVRTEGLGQIVIGAHVQRADLVPLLAPRADHDH